MKNHKTNTNSNFCKRNQNGLSCVIIVSGFRRFGLVKGLDEPLFWFANNKDPLKFWGISRKLVLLSVWYINLKFSTLMKLALLTGIILSWKTKRLTSWHFYYIYVLKHWKLVWLLLSTIRGWHCNRCISWYSCSTMNCSGSRNQPC